MSSDFGTGVCETEPAEPRRQTGTVRAKTALGLCRAMPLTGEKASTQDARAKVIAHVQLHPIGYREAR